MTAQIQEKILLNGTLYPMSSEPLNYNFSYWLTNGKNLHSPHTACYRGYVGTWEIQDNKLYLVKLVGYLDLFETLQLNDLFPHLSEDRLFADWFTGELVLNGGKMIEYVHSGYESRYEYTILLQLVNGEVIDSSQL